jgi:hypothetical protein
MTLSEAEFRVKMPCPSRYGAGCWAAWPLGNSGGAVARREASTLCSLAVEEAALTASYPDDILNVNETGLPGL